MKTLSAILLCSVILTPAFAAEAGGPLPSGTPAGVKQAQVEATNVPWLWIGVAAAAVIVGVAASGGGDKKGVTTVTTGTGS